MRLQQWRRILIVLAAVAVVLLAISIGYGLQHPQVHRATSSAPDSATPPKKPGPLTSVPPTSVVLNEQVGQRAGVYAGSGVPKRFTIWHDTFEAKWTGTTVSGDQFYFGPQGDVVGTNPDYFDVLFRWSANGEFTSARIVDLGANPSPEMRQAVQSQMLSTLGQFRLGDLHIQPFAATAFGIRFGFIPVPPSGGYPLAIELLPENNMAFTAPWTYGHYDT